MEWIKSHWKDVALALAALAMMVLYWADLHRIRTPAAPAVVAAPAPQVAHEVKTATPISAGTVKTFPNSVKHKLNLPAQVQASDTLQVLDVSLVPADDHPQVCATVIDLHSGETQTYLQRQPLPLFAIDTTGDAGLYVGLRNGSTALRADLRQSLFKIKAAHVGGIASIEQPLGGSQLPPSSFIGGGIWGQW